MPSTQTDQQTAIVIHPAIRGAESARAPAARMEEAVGLTAAINLKVVDAEIVSINQPKPATLMGRGKVDEIGLKLEVIKPRPDLVIIDGGKGQLNAALEVLDEFELRDAISIVGLAKR